MKNLFKTLLVCLMLACVGNLTTSCMQDVAPLGPPTLEFTGEPVVNNAISVDIPVNAVNLTKLAFMVEEYVEIESKAGEIEKWVIEGYDANGEPKLTKRKVEDNPAIQTIFFANSKGKGKVVEKVRKLESLHISGREGLDKNKKFVVYIAATVSQTEYLKDENGKNVILSATFETPEVYSDDDVTVIRDSYEGMDVSVTVPPSVLKANRRVRWGVTNIATVAYNEKKPVCEMLYLCDFVYPASIIARDTVLNINHHNAYRRNEKGEIGYYIINNGSVTEVSENSEEVAQGSASAIQYYYSFQPGEPLVLYLAEADYCSPETGLEPTVNFSFGNDVGWYWFPYDMDAYIQAYFQDPNVDPEQFWHEGAWVREVKLTLPGPKKFAGSVGVTVSDLSSNGGTITFAPDDKTFMYLVGLYEEVDQYGSGFRDITNKYLDGKEELWQWFTTAEMASQFGIGYYYASEGKQVLKLQEYFTTLTAGGKYHLVVNAVGAYTGEDQNLYPDMTSQNFQHIEFELKNYTLPEPELVVTAVDPYSPWKVKFNVKNPNWKTNPVSKVAFVSNFTREFESYMKANNYTYTDMVMINAYNAYYCLNDSDLELVNSNAGADIEFDAFENSAFTLAVIGWNHEGRASNPDKEGSQAVAEAKSMSIEPAERLDMTKLNALKGEWTATATVNIYDSSTGKHTPTQRSWKVTIGDLNTNEALTEAQYAILNSHGVDRDAADAYLAEYNKQAADYNVSVDGQNRVLCQGWKVDDDRTVATTSPWDLFLMEDYNASIIDYLFYDFGPKWFLQVDAEGNVFIPVHYNRIAPLTCWYNGMNHYLCGANYETGYAFYVHPNKEFRDNVQAAGLPATISADGNTVTITGYPVQLEDAEGNVTEMWTYPNIVYDYQGQIQFYNSHITSEVVLTRGWTEPAPEVTPSKMSAKNNVVSATKAAKAINGVTYTTPKRPNASTTFLPQTQVNGGAAKAKEITAKHPTMEEIHKGMEQYYIGRVPARR